MFMKKLVNRKISKYLNKKQRTIVFAVMIWPAQCKHVRSPLAEVCQGEKKRPEPQNDLDLHASVDLTAKADVADLLSRKIDLSSGGGFTDLTYEVKDIRVGSLT